MSLVETGIARTGALYRGREAFAEHSVSIKDTLRPQKKKIVFEAGPTNTVTRAIPEATDFAERVFNSLVALKVAVSQYAMHMSDAERHRIFAELDSVINTEDWHEEDELPKVEAFKDFLKWMIYSKYNKWISIGVSDDGDLMVAWKTTRVLLTAKFSGLSEQEAVRWTAQIMSKKGETGYTVGRSPLRLFSEQALFYLKGAEEDEGG
jgi:uncharacterized UPF0160 family protein